MPACQQWVDPVAGFCFRVMTEWQAGSKADCVCALKKSGTFPFCRNDLLFLNPLR